MLSACVTGLHGGDSSPSLVVSTTNNKYIFNCGEGLQRFCMEHRQRIVRCDGLFFTRICSETLGGLAGMLLTLADQGRPTLAAFGGPGLVDYLSATRHFMRRGDVVLNATEIADSSVDGKALLDLQLSDLTVRPIPVRARSERLREVLEGTLLVGRVIDSMDSHKAPAPSDLPWVYHPPSSTHGDSCVEIPFPFGPLRTTAWPVNLDRSAARAKLIDPAPWPHFWRHVEPRSSVVTSTSSVPAETTCCTMADEPTGATSSIDAPGDFIESEIAVSYVCWSLPLTGRFHADRAKAIGLKPGPAYGALQRNEDVRAVIPVKIALAAGLVDSKTAAAAEESFEAAQQEREKESLTTTIPDASSAVKKPDDSGSGTRKLQKRTAAPLPPPCATVEVTVTPSMVKDADIAGQGFLVAACPTLDFLEGLVTSPTLTRYYATPTVAAASSARDDHSLCAVFHTCPSHVAANVKYQNWVALFHSEVRHIFLCELSDEMKSGFCSGTSGSPIQAPGDLSVAAWPPIMFSAQAAQLCKLHLLQPSVFPLPYPLGASVAAACASADSAASRSESDVPHSHRTALQALAEPMLRERQALGATESGDSATLQPLASSPVSCPRIVQARPLLRYQFVPITATPCHDDASGTLLINPREAIAEVARDADAAALTLEAMNDAGKARDGRGSDDPQLLPSAFALTFTGTSSAIPCKYRNVSGMYLSFPPAAWSAATTAAINPVHQWAMILDPGEGTYGQLCRRFGPPRAPCIPSLTAHPESVDDALLAARVFWVSHMHADHHLGLVRLLVHR